jgi:CheY-like chemotaxis protein
MLTANALDEHVRSSQEAGADLHLSKPIHAQALIESIMVAIGAVPGGEHADIAAA